VVDGGIALDVRYSKVGCKHIRSYDVRDAVPGRFLAPDPRGINKADTDKIRPFFWRATPAFAIIPAGDLDLPSPLAPLNFFSLSKVHNGE
jgi:hypothetical protein